MMQLKKDDFQNQKGNLNETKMFRKNIQTLKFINTIFNKIIIQKENVYFFNFKINNPLRSLKKLIDLLKCFVIITAPF